jgi:hypothetical protein
MSRSSLLVLMLFGAAASIVLAQDPPSRAGRLNYVSGSVSFQPGGVDQWVAATVNRPLTVGDQLFADDGARAEVHIPGAAFRLGSKTAFQFLNLDDQTAQVKLSEGTLNIHVRKLEGTLEVDTPNMAYTIQAPGDYRIDTNPDTFETDVTARRGDGQITSVSGAAFGVHAGQEAVISGQDGAQYNVYGAQGADDFDNWVRTRDERDDRSQSSRYVSPDVVGYEDLDENGSWESAPGYGQAWVPRGVAADWAPYHSGHWAWVDPWGYSWVDDAPWGFAPFHYGRWAYFHEHWGWVPGPIAVAPVYAPALVAWFGVGGGGVGLSVGFGDGFGWCPLGPRDVYVPAYGASERYVTRINTTNTTVINNTQITNVYNNYQRTGNVETSNYSNLKAPNAVFAAPRNSLETGRPVQQGGQRVTPAQVASIRTFAAAPKVAPQQSALLGRTGGARVAQPPAQIVNRPVAAKIQPPAQPAPFAQRQAMLAKNPGHPVPIQQQQQLARSAPAAARPPVHVVAQARTVTPTVVNTPRPAAQATQRPGAPVPQQRPAEPPAQANRGVPPTSAPQASRPPAQAAQPNRSFEPPSAQRGTPQATREQPRVQPQPNRPAEPQSAQRPAPQASRPVEPQSAQRPTPQASRPVEPPAASRPSTPQREPAQAARPQPSRPEPQSAQRPAPQASRPVEPPAASRPSTPQREPAQAARPAPREQTPAPQRAEPPAPRPQQHAAQPAPRPQERPAQPAPRATQPPPQQHRAEPAPAKKPPEEKKKE